MIPPGATARFQPSFSGSADSTRCRRASKRLSVTRRFTTGQNRAPDRAGRPTRGPHLTFHDRRAGRREAGYAARDSYAIEVALAFWSVTQCADGREPPRPGRGAALPVRTREIRQRAPPCGRPAHRLDDRANQPCTRITRTQRAARPAADPDRGDLPGGPGPVPEREPVPAAGSTG